MGLEPTTPGITIQYSNQLSYIRRWILQTILTAPSWKARTEHSRSKAKRSSFFLVYNRWLKAFALWNFLSFPNIYNPDSSPRPGLGLPYEEPL